MTARERILLFLLVALVFGGGGFLGYKRYYVPQVAERDKRIETLQSEIQQAQLSIAKVQRDRAKLARWRQLSLPNDVDLARHKYEEYLSKLVRQSGFGADSKVLANPVDRNSTVHIDKKKAAVYTRLDFNVQLKGELHSLVEFMESFYHTELMHQIKSFSVKRPVTRNPNPQRQRDLDINLTIEALVLADGEKRQNLMPVDRVRVAAGASLLAAHLRGPGALAVGAALNSPGGPLGASPLAQPARDYAALANRNIFLGPRPYQPAAPRDSTNYSQYVRLTRIIKAPLYTEAWLYDRYNNKNSRLRAEAGFDSINVLDNEGNRFVYGKVLRIDQQELVIRIEEARDERLVGKHYKFHVGMDLTEAMQRRNELSKEQLQGLGIKVAAAAPAAKEKAKGE